MTYARVPDWPAIRGRYTGFWECATPADRCLMQVQNLAAEKPPHEAWMDDPAFAERKYLDPDLFFRLVDARRGEWHWHGDLFQYRIPSFAPNSLAMYCGARVVFGATIWQGPVIERIEDADRVRFDPENRFWRNHLEAVDCFIERCRGREPLGMTDFGGPADWIGTLMGTSNLCLAVAENPDAVRDFALRLADVFRDLWDIVYARVAPHFDGTCNWLPMWGPGRLGVVQDDLSILFSPAVYREVFIPAIRRMASHFEKTLFHFHNGCIHQLDNLLAVPEISAIQFGMDPAMPPIVSYEAALRRTQEAGKGLFIGVLEPADVRPLIERLDPRNLLLLTTAPDDDTSRRLVADSTAWTQERVAALGLDT